MTCDQCGKQPGHGDTFVHMQPGRDKKPYVLCSRCFRYEEPRKAARR
jgi:hypothetical protein